MTWLCSPKPLDPEVQTDLKSLASGEWEPGRYPQIGKQNERFVRYFETHGLRHFHIWLSLQDDRLIRGARVTSARDSSKPELRGNPVPQVAFRKFGEDEWHWFLGNELDQVEGWERFRADAETLIVGPPGDDVSRL